MDYNSLKKLTGEVYICKRCLDCKILDNLSQTNIFYCIQKGCAFYRWFNYKNPSYSLKEVFSLGGLNIDPIFKENVEDGL